MDTSSIHNIIIIGGGGVGSGGGGGGGVAGIAIGMNGMWLVVGITILPY